MLAFMESGSCRNTRCSVIPVTFIQIPWNASLYGVRAWILLAETRGNVTLGLPVLAMCGRAQRREGSAELPTDLTWGQNGKVMHNQKTWACLQPWMRGKILWSLSVLFYKMRMNTFLLGLWSEGELTFKMLETEAEKWLGLLRILFTVGADHQKIPILLDSFLLRSQNSPLFFITLTY